MSIYHQTLIITDNGWKKCEDLNKTDILFNDEGKKVKIKNIIKEDVSCQLKEITFSDNERLVISSDVSLLTMNYKERMQITRLSDDFREKRRLTRKSRSKGIRPDLTLKNSDRTYEYKEKPKSKYRIIEEIQNNVLEKNNRKNYSILINKPIKFSKKNNSIDPYLAGVWLGDGDTYQSAITTADEEILNAIEKLGYVVKKGSGKYSYRINGLWTDLLLNGLVGTVKEKKPKKITEQLLRNTVEVRKELLMGLMDTDGSIDQRGQCEFSVVNKELCEGFFRFM